MMAQAIIVDRRHTMGQLLGYGQEEQPGDYTKKRRDELCKQFAPAVWNVCNWARVNHPHSELHRRAILVRMEMDKLNEDIDSDAMGGNTGGGARFPELPAKMRKRVDLENAARRAWAAIGDGIIGEAVNALGAGLRAISQKALDAEADCL